MAGSQKILHVAGYDSCEYKNTSQGSWKDSFSHSHRLLYWRAGGFFTRALSVLRSVSILFPTRIKVIPHSFEDQASYKSWLIDDGVRTCFQDPRAHSHSTSPICWFAKTESDGFVKEDIQDFLGGHDDAL